jgi:hypothetical protein
MRDTSGQDGGTGRHDHAHRRHVRIGQPGMLQAGDQHGRNTEKHRAVLLFDEPDQQARVEVRQQHKRARARDRSKDCESATDDVEQRHATYLNHAVLQTEGIDIYSRAVDNATVMKDRPFRASGGAGGVQDLCGRTGIDLRQQLIR